jgi:excisionase family DNA binding protein
MQIAAGYLTEKLAYSPAEVMAMLGIGKNTIYNLIASGKLSAKRIGNRKWLIPRVELEKFLEK